MGNMQLIVGTSEKGRDLATKDLNRLLQIVGQDHCRASFRTLFEHFAPRLKSFFLKVGTNEETAEELIQETFVQVWRKAHLYDAKKAAASTWIFTIARNRRIDRFRSEKSFVYRDDQYFADTLTCEAQQADDVYQGEMEERVKHAIGLLSANQAEIIRLSFFQEASHREIAAKLSLPLGTVKSRLRLAFKHLRTILREMAP
ncbi:RNA polymerase sigma-70 factor, ECF subfamily [Cohaesibacter gelatinilyticus]|uniref:RNA polymerase sigma factor n=2 Tax=Cohaesibacter gelatinilyticus TaxID=372072 RepID=A0A285PBA8_9HYPH|nr:RNA polymerase sigma-70 factor, ECF subfamily [Cohaesibacter gelatinilyticus]